MSELPKTEPSPYECPVCKGCIDVSSRENLIVLGIVLRDVVPMATLASVICNRHTNMILDYYDIMLALSTAYNEVDGNIPDIKIPPPKNMN